MPVGGGFDVIRDPLWNNIGIDAAALAVIDTAPFQRLRYVRQLGHAFLVYPGATHTRFEHALGAYHLARRALGLLEERGALADVPPDDVHAVRFAALLHDIGHYPFSHALEEAGLPSHEDLALEHLQHPELVRVLDRAGLADVPERLVALIRGRSASPLQGLISGPIDLDKIDYLSRDARMAGVPYGVVDVDRLLHSLTLVRDPTDRLVVGIHGKGVSALESLLFAKYEMYRNVYWHHAIRSATSMFKRLVRDAIAAGRLEVPWIAHSTDEELMVALRALPDAPLAQALRARRLYKRVLDLSAAELPEGLAPWLPAQPDLVRRLEDRLAAELGLPAGGLLLDFPAKPEMLASDVLVTTRHGTVAPARLGLQQVAETLHTAARRLRLFAAEPRTVAPDVIVGLLEGSASDVESALAAETIFR